MARMKAHQVDLPLSLGAWITFSPSWNVSVSFSSLPKEAVSLRIIMADHLLAVVDGGQTPARCLLDVRSLVLGFRGVIPLAQL